VLKISHISHTGLKEVYQSSSTLHPPPQTAEWSASRRRLLALNVATNPSDAALPAYGLRPGLRKGHEFAPLPSGGIIEFDWAGSYARSVDWR
jgi:hypothetical protein